MFLFILRKRSFNTDGFAELQEVEAGVEAETEAEIEVF
jgi:hypothetical protein